MSETILPKAKRGCLSWVAWPLGILAAAFLLLMSARNVWMLQMPFHLLAGGVLHAQRAFAHFTSDLPKLMTAAVLPCLATAIALWGAHRLILWWRLANGNRDGWRFKHTALAGSLVLLGSAAAIALSGVVHEAVWLPQGKVIQSNIRNSGTYARMNARQLGVLLFEHENEYGAYPSSLLNLEEIEKDPANLRRIMFVDLDPPSPPEPFIFLGSGKTAEGNPSRLLAISPVIPEWDVFIALKMDYSVTSMPASKFAEVVKSAAGEKLEGK
ncbi:MAG: hypothetical protein V4640_02740 [Verrucomicrobiota bacterium]